MIDWDELEYWNEIRWESKHGKSFFRTEIVDGIEFHMAGDRCMYRCDPVTGRQIKPGENK